MGRMKVMCHTQEQLSKARRATWSAVRHDALVTRNVPGHAEPLYDLSSSIELSETVRVDASAALAASHAYHHAYKDQMSGYESACWKDGDDVYVHEARLREDIRSKLRHLKSALDKEPGVPYVLSWEEYLHVLYWALEGVGHDRSSMGTITGLFKTLPPPAAAADLGEWTQGMQAAVAASGLESTPHKRCVCDAVRMLLVDIADLRQAR